MEGGTVLKNNKQDSSFIREMRGFCKIFWVKGSQKNKLLTLMTLLFMVFFLRGSSFETDKIAAGNNSTCSHHDQHSMETAFCPPLGEKLPKVICHP